MLLASRWRRHGHLRPSASASAHAFACISQLTKLQCLESALNLMESQTASHTSSSRYARIIKECCALNALSHGKRVHAHIIRNGVEVSNYVGNLMIRMYGRWGGSVHDARKVFEMMKDRDVVSWTSMIAAYARHGDGRKALSLFALMRPQGLQPNRITFLSILAACCHPQFIEDGKKIHAEISDNGLDSDIVVATALMKMYGKCHRLEDVRKVFVRIPRRDAVVWTVLISAFCQNGDPRAAIQFFFQMRREGVQPDAITLATTLNACSKSNALPQGKRIHEEHIRGSQLERDVDVANALINMFGKCGDAVELNSLFNQMPGRNIISWNSLISAYTQFCSGAQEILELCGKMQWQDVDPDKITCLSILDACSRFLLLREGCAIHAYISEKGWERDAVLGTALISMYSKCGSLDEANRVFEDLSDPDLVAWNAIIAAHAHHGQGKKSLQLFDFMQQQGVKADDFSWVSLLDACASPELLAEGKLIHTQIIEEGLEGDVIVGNALVNMYGKAGSVDNARRAFDKMKTRDLISWNAMISVYAQHGNGREALQVFQEMIRAGLNPDNITYLSTLDACASLADQTKGKFIHASILNRKFPLDVSLENAILDMYGKGGSLEDAYGVFYSMKSRDTVSWNTLIAACARHGRGSLALQAFGQMHLEAAKVDDLTMIAVLTACNHAGQIEEGCHYNVSTEQRRNYSFVEHFGYGSSSWSRLTDDKP